MSHNPLFSIIVPVYKVEAYLDHCVRSLKNQTYCDIEILLVDDGSPDRCGEMCDSYAAADPRIKVIHKANGGLSDARNAGLDAATGNYIILVDSDDSIAEDTCQRLVPFAREEYDIIIGDGLCSDGKKRLSHGHTQDCLSGEAYLKLALKAGSMPMAAWLYIYKRSFLAEHQLRFKYGIAHEDEQFTPRAFLAAGRVVESGVNFYRYLIREDSITTQRDLRKNVADLYETCLELKTIYDGLADQELQTLLVDSLVEKYLSLYQTGKMYRYGKAYTHKKFVTENAKRPKTKGKALLFSLSPRLYWHINDFSKKRK